MTFKREIGKEGEIRFDILTLNSINIFASFVGIVFFLIGFAMMIFTVWLYFLSGTETENTVIGFVFLGGMGVLFFVIGSFISSFGYRNWQDVTSIEILPNREICICKSVGDFARFKREVTEFRVPEHEFEEVFLDREIKLITSHHSDGGTSRYKMVTWRVGVRKDGKKVRTIMSSNDRQVIHLLSENLSRALFVPLRDMSGKKVRIIQPTETDRSIKTVISQDPSIKISEDLIFSFPGNALIKVILFFFVGIIVFIVSIINWNSNDPFPLDIFYWLFYWFSEIRLLLGFIGFISLIIGLYYLLFRGEIVIHDGRLLVKNTFVFGRLVQIRKHSINLDDIEDIRYSHDSVDRKFFVEILTDQMIVVVKPFITYKDASQAVQKLFGMIKNYLVSQERELTD